VDNFKSNLKKPSELFARAALFGIFFVIVLIFFIITAKNEKTGGPDKLFMNGMAKYTGFKETQKDELKARNGGFWQYASDTNAANSIIYVTDRFELKTNGIFWQVTEYTLGLPSKKSIRYLHLVNGYMNPFAMAGNNLDSIVCDVHIIQQAYIMGNDTCYGPGNTDTTMVVVANGKRFEFENRVYAPYDTSGPALYCFFPKGILDIVNKITLYQCSKRSDFISFAKNAVASDMGLVKVDSLTDNDVSRIIDAYYRGFLENLLSGKSTDGRGKLKVSFDVAWEGKVTSLRIIENSRQFNELRKQIESDINSWTFPQLKVKGRSIHIEREFWF
jgi:hypothetical protein